jgi:SAM-dependent methyltransferase
MGHWFKEQQNRGNMNRAYVHGYDHRENIRLQDQASTLVELLHSDTSYPAGSRVLEAGCGVGAQTVTLARNSPEALITSVDISGTSVTEAKAKVEAAGFTHVHFQQADIFNLPHAVCALSGCRCRMSRLWRSEAESRGYPARELRGGRKQGNDIEENENQEQERRTQ